MIHDHCVACGDRGNLNRHHLLPRSLGGPDTDDNLITLCGACHAKAHQSRANWRHSELTSRALQHKKAQGEKTGGAVPYGFALAADGITLIEHPAEQAVIRQAKELKESSLSLRKVAAELDRQGIKARNGQTFQATQIQRMMVAALKENP